jgi:hypothetical protein
MLVRSCLLPILIIGKELALVTSFSYIKSRKCKSKLGRHLGLSLEREILKLYIGPVQEMLLGKQTCNVKRVLNIVLVLQRLGYCTIFKNNSAIGVDINVRENLSSDVDLKRLTVNY